MGIFHDICHKCIIDELKNETNTNVVLVTVDGFVYYGNLYRVKDSRLAILTPGTVTAPGVPAVRILRPNGAVFNSDFASHDICTVTNKATGLTTSPF